MTTETVPLLELTPADVADLTDTLRPYHAISGSFFSRSESRAWAERYRHGLLSPLARTSVEPMVIAQHGASEQAVRGMQQCLTDSTWNDAAILRRHWQEVAVDLDDTAVWHMSFWCACSGDSKKASALSLEQLCLLLSVLLPLPSRRREDVLDQIASWQRRHAAARTSQHRRTERWIADMDALGGCRTRPVAPPMKA